MDMQVPTIAMVFSMIVTVAVIIVLLTVMMVTVVGVTLRVMVMDVHMKACVDTGRRCKGHADRGRKGKRKRNRPNEGATASACSLQSRQHVVLFFRLFSRFPRVDDLSLALLRRKAHVRLGLRAQSGATASGTLYGLSWLVSSRSHIRSRRC
jgi:hypothetical protein